MPILNVEIVLRPGEALAGRIAAEIADRAGELFGSPPGETWVKVTGMAPEQYAENGMPAAGGPFPVLVTVVKARQAPPETMQQEVARLTTIVARACHRPEENVHLLYLPDAVGRIAFGGQMLTE